MKQRSIHAIVLMLGCALAPSLAQDKKPGDNQQPKSQPPSKDDPAHDELRAVKKAMTDAFNKKDIDALLKHAHPEAIVTWQNGEVSKGPEGVRKYYERMLVGESSILIGVTADPQVTDLAVLFGTPPTTAVAYGKLKDNYKLRDGTDIDMNSLFSATLVKENGRWLIVSFHGSTNIFDNAVLKTAVTRTMWLSGGIAGVAGLLIGLLGGRMLGRRKT